MIKPGSISKMTYLIGRIEGIAVGITDDRLGPVNQTVGRILLETSSAMVDELKEMVKDEVKEVQP